MKSSVSHLILIALMLTLLECVLCYNYGREEDPSVNQRLDRLEKKVEILTNEMHKHFSETESSEDDQGESTQQHGVTILEVRREEEGEMIRFTVKYDSGEETVEARWLNLYLQEENSSGNNTALGDGVYETTAMFPSPEDDNNNNGNVSFVRPSSIWLSLELPDNKEEITLALNLADDYAIQTDVPTPRLDIEPAGDFVYQEGEEFSFKMRIPSIDEDGPSSRMENIHLYGVLLDPATGKVSLSHQTDDILQIGEKKKFQNYEEVIARIKGTENGVSGLLYLNSQMQTIDSEVVNSVLRGKLVILRPSTQEGPFPDGYLGVVEKPNGEGYGDTTNDEDVLVCNLDEDCHYECVVAGNDYADVIVRRIQAGGYTQTLSSKELSRVSPYLSRKEVTFHVDSIPDQPDKIQCVADNAEGMFVSKEVNIVVSTPVAIVEQDSGIVMVNRDENEAVFEVSCTVKGNPQPSVTFNIYGSHSQFGEEPDVISDRGDNTYTMIKTVTYDTEVVNSSWFYLSADCNAHRNGPYWGSEYYSMSYESNDSK